MWLTKNLGAGSCAIEIQTESDSIMSLVAFYLMKKIRSSVKKVD